MDCDVWNLDFETLEIRIMSTVDVDSHGGGIWCTYVDTDDNFEISFNPCDHWWSLWSSMGLGI
jgi:hypothetical protein